MKSAVEIAAATVVKRAVTKEIRPVASEFHRV